MVIRETKVVPEAALAGPSRRQGTFGTSPTVKLRLALGSEAFNAYVFIFPLLLGVLVFFIWPIVASFYISFTNWDSLTKPIFVGLRNYQKIFGDLQVGREFLNTVYFALGTVIPTIILSVILANLLNKDLKGRSVFRVIYYLPVITMPVAVALVWQWLFNSHYGLIDIALGALFQTRPIWLGDPNLIMPAVIIVTIWSGIGYNMIFLLAGLQSIPRSLYEACEIDGANGTTVFFRVTLPLLTPTLFFLLTISVMGAFKAFDMIYMFSGAANSTQGPLVDHLRTMVYGIFQAGFTNYRMGYASAEAFLLFMIIMLLTILQNRLQKLWVHYDK